MVQFISILPTSLRRQQQSLNQTSYSQQTPPTLPSRASYGVSIARILKKTECVITALHCTIDCLMCSSITISCCFLTAILVTGASGYIATHIVQQLLEEGYHVRGTVRDLKNEAKVKPLQELCPDAKHPLELVEADLTKEDSWER